MPEEKKKITIKVYDKEYPCYPTMGAAVKFKDLTGHDIEDMKGSADVASYVYCCAKSACKREKTEFNISFEDFSDGVLLEVWRTLTHSMLRWLRLTVSLIPKKKTDHT